MNISVIVALYKRYRHLYWCLKSLANQTVKDFEVIIADDGTSGVELEHVKNIINEYSSLLDLQHIWHPDNGFQKSLILNKAVKASKGELLVFLDCDVIFDKYLVETYYKNFLKLSKQYDKLLFTGDMIFLRKDISEKIFSNKSLTVEQAISMIRNDFNFNEILYREFRYLKYFYYKIFRTKYPKGWGANKCITKKAYLSVNGYDNSFKGRGEDTDFMKRLVLNGTKRVALNKNVVAYHLYHKMVIEPEEVRKKTRERLKWEYYQSNPEIIVTPDGLNQC